MIGLGKIREYWLPELLAMGVKWVKFIHDGGEGLAELLLANEIMPVVRLYRPQPNPGVLGNKEIEFLDRYLALGVKYFEFNNEPDLSVEWRNGQVPENALEIVVRNAMRDMELILERGGYPAVPALAVGTKWDIVGKICELGGEDLFEGGVWQAIHNYGLNHPLDYPYDDVNQKGTPISRKEYDRLAAERWGEGESTWGADSLERVNRRRVAGTNPGDTVHEDPSTWRSYEFFDMMVCQHLGRSIPVLSTENGINVGDRADPRYSGVTPQLHMERTLEMCRIMMGTSTRFDKAPAHYFCTAFWLIGNYTLGHMAVGWESQAWYSPRWPGGKLPIVEALKAEPKRKRRPISKRQPQKGVIKGRVRDDGAGQRVSLRRGERIVRTVKTSSKGTFRFEKLKRGRYSLTIKGTNIVRRGVVTDGRSVVTADLSLLTDSSVIQGVVRGGAGRKIILRSDGQVAETTIASDGAYRFQDLPAGEFSLTVEGVDVGRSGLLTDGRNTIVVDLVVPQWSWTISTEPIGGGDSIVRCSVIGRKDLSVRLYTSGWEGIVGRTGTKPEYGQFACEFAPLREATYVLEPERLGVKAEFALARGTVATVEFTEEAAVAEGEERAEEAPTKEFEHYLLLRQALRDRATSLAVTRYAAHFSPTVGSDPTEAERARYVTILGSTRTVSASDERRLKEAGCLVERIAEDIAGTVERLVAEDKPFATL